MAEVAKESMPHHDKNEVPVEREFDQASFSSDETQTGVKTVEAVSQTWTQSALIAAYLGYVLFHCLVGHEIFFRFCKTIILPREDELQFHQVESLTDPLNGFPKRLSSSVYSDSGGLTGRSIFLLAFCTSLEGQTTINLVVYATSAFSKHSLVATVLVVQGVVNGKVSHRQTQSKHVFTMC